MNLDLIIRGGTIVDGTGRPAFKGDLAVSANRIVEAAPESSGVLEGAEAVFVLDASGLIVAPGFIDMHSHNDFVLPREEHPKLLACMLEQGCTTMVCGNCGFSPAPFSPYSKGREQLDMASQMLGGTRLPHQWGSMDSFLGYLEHNGVSMNIAQLEGHGTLRLAKLGLDFNPPSPPDMVSLGSFVDESLEAGAYGLSFGLGYTPGMFSGEAELESLAKRVAARDGVLAVHLKALSRISPGYGVNPFSTPHNLRALKEMLDLARRIGVKLQISHLIFVGKHTWPTAGRALELIDQARDGGLDVMIDSYPQMAGNTTVLAIYPDWFLMDIENKMQKPLARLRLELEWSLGFKMVGFGFEDIQLLWGAHKTLEKYSGLFLKDIARDMGISMRSAYIRITQTSRGQATGLLYKYSGDEYNQEPLRQVLAHRLNLFMTDALINENGASNPGAYGTFPRLIDQVHRQWGLLSLEETIARMTGKSAERFGLKDRGFLKPGNWADIVVFDYESIRDNTTPTESRKRPSGISQVFLNGQWVVRDGVADTESRYGMVLRRE